MKIQTITTGVINTIKKELKKLFNNDIKSVKIQCLCPSKIINILQNLGADVSDEIETNGWQYDYWIKVKYKDKKYCISGSGYYGSVEIAKSDE